MYKKYSSLPSLLGVCEHQGVDTVECRLSISGDMRVLFCLINTMGVNRFNS